VSLHYAAAKGDYPLALRLFLPESWTSQPDRMDRRASTPGAPGVAYQESDRT